MASKLGYTTRANIENFLHRTFTEASDTEFDGYINSAEKYINNYTGYNAQTTTSGMLTETITREKTSGKIDPDGNLVIDVMKPPINFDANNNPLVTLVEYNFGGIRVPLQITDGTTNALNTLLEVSENRKKIVYPSIYFLPYLPTVTPTKKMNLFSLKDLKFWVDVSYTGGYSSVPDDVTQAANYLVTEMIVQRDNPNNAVRVRQGAYDIQYMPSSQRFVKGQPISRNIELANALLQPYVRYTW